MNDTLHNSIGAKIKQPAEKILVISENPELSLFFKQEIDSIRFEHPLQLEFRYTALCNSPQQMIVLGAREINVKDQNTINEIIDEYNLVFSLHCKQIFPQQLVENICCINFHPGFNPYNRGWFPQTFSIINNLPTGATIHLMDAGIDHGKIIAQQRVEIHTTDTSLEVYKKIIQAEKELIHRNIFNIIEGIFETSLPSSEGNYNSVKDYKKLCELNLDNVGSLKEHINLLRATTHGSYKNAYFCDNDGKKYFVRITIEEDIATKIS